MSILERNRRAAILAIGVVFALIGPLWIGDRSGLGGIVFVLAVEAIPFLALAAAAPSMPWWLGIVFGLVIGLMTALAVWAHRVRPQTPSLP